jgi:hypothetical protein
MSDRLAAAVQALVFLVVFAASGALAGVVWERLWDAPEGLVYQGRWYLEPAGPDHAFSGTGWYVVVALVAGALTTLALGWLLPRHELASLAAMAVGSMLAGWVMFKVGHALGPEDPQTLAAGKADLSTLPSDLLIVGADDQPRLFRFDSSAFAAFPVGAMTAAVYLFLAVSGRRSGHSAGGRDLSPQAPEAG